MIAILAVGPLAAEDLRLSASDTTWRDEWRTPTNPADIVPPRPRWRMMVQGSGGFGIPAGHELTGMKIGGDYDIAVVLSLARRFGIRLGYGVSDIRMNNQVVRYESFYFNGIPGDTLERRSIDMRREIYDRLVVGFQFSKETSREMSRLAPTWYVYQGLAIIRFYSQDTYTYSYEPSGMTRITSTNNKDWRYTLLAGGGYIHPLTDRIGISADLSLDFILTKYEWFYSSRYRFGFIPKAKIGLVLAI